MNRTDHARASAGHVAELLASRKVSLARPAIGIILGSGLGAAADRLVAEGGCEIRYADIPHMPVTQVTGHSGRLVVGRLADIPILMLSGRVHAYEGHTLDAITFGVRLLCALGANRLIVTNAAGGIRRGFSPGDLMLIRDTLRWPGLALGGNVVQQDQWCWPEWLRDVARRTATTLTVHDGIYAMMPGPNYETPAEIRMLQSLGADAVGMSTVPEAMMAASLGVPALGVSCITNVAAGLSDQLLSHHDVTATASAIESRFVDWILNVAVRMGTSAAGR